MSHWAAGDLGGVVVVSIHRTLFFDFDKAIGSAVLSALHHRSGLGTICPETPSHCHTHFTPLFLFPSMIPDLLPGSQYLSSLCPSAEAKVPYASSSSSSSSPSSSFVVLFMYRISYLYKVASYSACSRVSEDACREWQLQAWGPEGLIVPLFGSGSSWTEPLH